MSVISLALSPTHEFTKTTSENLTLLPGLGVKGDCHCGETVQHRSRLHIRPPPKNLRQVHLMDLEILQQFDVKPADLGENVTTQGLDLLGKSQGTKLHFISAAQMSTSNSKTTNAVVLRDLNDAGASLKEILAAPHPVVVLTGLRNPCPQIQQFRAGLQEKFIVRGEDRRIVDRKAGVMSVVEVGGDIHVGMAVVVEEPVIFKALECV